MKTLDSMTKDERSLLLYFETCAVEHGGRIDSRRMNKGDFDIAKGWNAEGFTHFGRIKYHSIINNMTHWCELSDDAWTLAHAERKRRFLRSVADQTYEKV